MTPNHIKVETDGPVASLVFNRPQVLNAFNNEAMDECRAALHDLAEDDRVRAVLVRGEGRAFSAGFDMKAAAERDMSTVDHVRRQMERQFDFIMAFWDCPKPTIALVHGFCMAGAFEVALACDITLAAEGHAVRRARGPLRHRHRRHAAAVGRAAQARQGDAADRQRQDGRRRARTRSASSITSCRRRSWCRSAGAWRSTSRPRPGPPVFFTKRAMNRTYEIMGMRDALRASLDIDVILNATPSAEKAEFQRIRKEQGLKAALAWRDGRFSDGRG